MMNGRGKSDPVIVAVKPTNQAERSAGEPVEPRAATKGNAGQQSACRAGQTRHRRWNAYGKHFAVWTRGRSRTRESCTYAGTE